MTALKPIENRRVKGAASTRYPLGKTCAHPDCTETNVTAHHLFPRSLIKGTQWFVEIEDLGYDADGPKRKTIIIPHVVPLCGSGTTGHHGDAEEHRAWIKLEGGEFVWYDRDSDEESTEAVGWNEVGALNPQPAMGEGKPKRRGKKHGEPRAGRQNWTIKVPLEQLENGADVLDELIDAAHEILVGEDALVEDAPRYATVQGALAIFVRDYGRKK